MASIFFSPKKAIKHPWKIFVLAFVYASISLIFARWVFPEYASIAMIFLTVFTSLYLIQSATKLEEKKEGKSAKEKWLIKEHSKLIKLLLFLFLGFTLAFSVWAFALPVEEVSSIFSFQDSAVNILQDNISGSFTQDGTLFRIFFNNIQVLLISLIFAIFYGAGAIYVLVWNASVMGLVIGNLARETLGIVAIPIAFAKYFIHGIPEMLAYLTTALAGGLIFVAFWKGDFKNKDKRKSIILDVSMLVAISIALLILGALLEVYVSPLV